MAMQLVFSSSRRALPMLLSLAVLAFALALLWLGRWADTAMPADVTIREIALLEPPPPPPPPPAVQAPRVDAPIALQAEGSGPVLKMIKLDRQAIEIAQPEIPAVRTAQPQWQSLDVNWDAFSMDELDTLPSLLTPLHVVFPKSLSRRGIDAVLVKLDVLIDERGQVRLIDVVENPYPELKPEIDAFVRNSRFTAPERNGAPVRARFIWPVEIRN